MHDFCRAFTEWDSRDSSRKQSSICLNSMKCIFAQHNRKKLIWYSCKVETCLVFVLRVSFSFIYPLSHFEGGKVPRIGQSMPTFSVSDRFWGPAPPDLHVFLECERKPEETHSNSDRTRISKQNQTWEYFYMLLMLQKAFLLNKGKLFYCAYSDTSS